MIEFERGAPLYPQPLNFGVQAFPFMPALPQAPLPRIGYTHPPLLGLPFNPNGYQGALAGHPWTSKGRAR